MYCSKWRAKKNRIKTHARVGNDQLKLPEYTFYYQGCLVPLMKSKKGERICFGCNRDFNKPIAEEKPKRNVAK